MFNHLFNIPPKCPVDISKLTCLYLCSLFYPKMFPSLSQNVPLKVVQVSLRREGIIGFFLSSFHLLPTP